jgi:malate dehydrogenase
MVPIIKLTTVSGKPISELFTKEGIEQLVKRTQNGGAEIVSLLKHGSAFYAPSSGAVLMVESILRDEKKVLPCSVLLEGEYGFHDIFLGVPVVLGAAGVEKIVELDLNEEETTALKRSARIVKEGIRGLGLPVR